MGCLSDSTPKLYSPFTTKKQNWEEERREVGKYGGDRHYNETNTKDNHKMIRQKVYDCVCKTAQKEKG